MATFWLANGVQPKVVSERLGHANVNITLQVYGHVLPNMQAEAADALDGAFFGTRQRHHGVTTSEWKPRSCVDKVDTLKLKNGVLTPLCRHGTMSWTPQKGLKILASGVRFPPAAPVCAEVAQW